MDDFKFKIDKNNLSELESKNNEITKDDIKHALLLSEISSLQIKNTVLELRVKRLEVHLTQILKHVEFPVGMLQWGVESLARIFYIFTRV